MTWWQAIILGIVEGLTEYLPVSSTGHLLVVQQMLGIGLDGDQSKQAADAYAICIQAGAIVAVLSLYWRRVGQMGRGLRGSDQVGKNLLQNIIVGFVPAAVLGLVLSGLIKSYLFGPWPIVFAWFVGGLLILIVAAKRQPQKSLPVTGENGSDGLTLEQLTWRMALIIGLAQCLAMWPGTSRSLMTIVGGVLVGLRLAAAVEFSFLLGVVTLGAATCYDLVKHGHVMLENYQAGDMIIGFLCAFVAALMAVRWMVSYLKSHGMQIFGWYRIAIALLVAAMLLGGVLTAGTSANDAESTAAVVISGQ
jgi:undecaprenyl-diphosphatase